MREEILLRELENAYGIDITSIEHIREMIGLVFRLHTATRTLCFKVYPASWNTVCVKSAHVQDHVARTSDIAPVVHVSIAGELVTDLLIDDESYVGFLMDYIDGSPVDRTADRTIILTLAETLHHALASYTLPLVERNEMYYVNLFEEFANQERLDPKYVDQVNTVLRDMYHRVRHLPRGVVHGDFHTGNLIRRNDGQLMIIDFDSVGIGHPHNDLATCFDTSHFNHFQPADFQRTKALFQTIAKQDFVSGMLAYLPLRHMEIIAAIGLRHGTDSFHDQLMDQQLSWITAWRTLLNQLSTQPQ